MVRRLAMRAFVASASVAALACWSAPLPAKADPPVVFPGMEIHQDNRVCTLGYVDPALKIAFTAGHCRGNGVVYDREHNAIGRLATFRDNTPSGTTVATDQMISDYEAIVLDSSVTANNILPGGRPLESNPSTALQPGEAVCHFGVVTGETCGTVESINNGWFTMSHGVQSQKRRFGRTGVPGAQRRPRGDRRNFQQRVGGSSRGGVVAGHLRPGPPRSRRDDQSALTAPLMPVKGRVRARTRGSRVPRRAAAHRWSPVSTRRHSP